MSQGASDRISFPIRAKWIGRLFISTLHNVWWCDMQWVCRSAILEILIALWCFHESCIEHCDLMENWKAWSLDSAICVQNISHTLIKHIITHSKICSAVWISLQRWNPLRGVLSVWDENAGEWRWYPLCVWPLGDDLRYVFGRWEMISVMC